MLGDRSCYRYQCRWPRILATDAVVASGLTLATLSDESKSALRVCLARIFHSNPIDVLGDAKADRFEQVLTLLSKSTDTDAILVIITPQFVTKSRKHAKSLLRFRSTQIRQFSPFSWVILSSSKANKFSHNCFSLRHRDQPPYLFCKNGGIRITQKRDSY
jgi:acyl-CoA synthetase (NDP forming)